jgi:heme/copper-type cytochrome/quinol oxidase subunit 2
MSLGLAVVGIAPTPSIFAPVSTPAFAIRELSFLVLAIVTFIFVVVAGLTVYAIIRYRGTTVASRPRCTAAHRSSWHGRWCRSSS